MAVDQEFVLFHWKARKDMRLHFKCVRTTVDTLLRSLSFHASNPLVFFLLHYMTGFRYYFSCACVGQKYSPVDGSITVVFKIYVFLC